MPQPYWATAPAAYDDLLIGPPGRLLTFALTRVTVTGDIGGKWDIKEAPGTDGARERWQGYTPTAVNLTWLIYTEEHKGRYEQLLAEVKPKPGKTRPAKITAVHPWLALHGLGDFIVDSIAIPRRQGPQIYEAAFKLIEWFAQPKPTKLTGAAAAAVAARGDISSVKLSPELRQKIATPPQPPSKTGAAKP